MAESTNILYRQLTASECVLMREINPSRFIKRAWRKINGVKQWIDINWKDDDYPDGYENHYEALIRTIEGGGFVVGAFDSNQFVGFCSVNRDVFGNQFKYVLLDQIFVSNKFQGLGIGKKLFFLSAEKVKQWNVDKLYICAGSSEDTLAFYKSLGCVDAVEINRQLYESDENDIQLEYVLGRLANRG